MTRRAVAVALALTLASVPAWGADAPGKAGAEEYRPPAWPESPGAAELGGRLGLMALLTVGVAGAVIWWARRLPAATAGEGDAVPMAVVEEVSLGGGCSLHLLQVDQGHFLVGIDASGLKVMHALNQTFDQVLDQDGEEGEGEEGGPETPPAPDVPAAARRSA